MAKGSRVKRRFGSRQYRQAPYLSPAYNQDISSDSCPKKCSKILDKKDWVDVTCSVCMECPHNAVLLLCSSHDKGCRPYMCGTSFRYSNCLDQYKNAYTKIISSTGTAENPILVSDSSQPVEKCEATELACPLCRGQVKGWTVVEPAREYLNAKKRSCMQDDCSFIGTYKELRKHVKTNHPSARPRGVDPILEQKWRRLEREREHDDVISTIRSTMPGAMVFGDYVIEGSHYGFDTDEDGGFDADATERNEGFEVGFDRNLVNVFLLLHAFGPTGDDHSRRLRHPERTDRQMTDESAVSFHHTSPVEGLGLSDEDDDNNINDDNGDDSGMSLVSRLRRHGRMLLGRSGRRRRRREGIGGQR
ncbi:hypothetical protein POPTR_003G021800v4 [Populus trichocarpa]|uniref:Uncharacterized protein n=3 Tax=Populus trichocarpa TaxID=3694 RepID=A0ACC0T6X7_POPTR|nr:uncharacterized protein LOC7478132 [Populus trichocarpa]XP_024453516.2 uncharacterized protein LOC7478132 [Populus trichocarpa]XP_024453517.2 uncharacterized protein LOC7478132 [Populus trichocarpa]XP_024453518.2 uncharacterized protein LOC7478132 [Populus trichocarpa]KAI9397281.1 hypothetical protein POPTR_003G021800v4 [Populus trichocarpa]KAI9397282.1 hypothetical protein POPTR_003G021800v4 [Populus trichocarpa]KAI9397283.1 hypothetical protein POPTR_003G021800v4 [Populus trichocarpa]